MLLMAHAATVSAYTAAPLARAAGSAAMRNALLAGRPAAAQCASRCFGVQCSEVTRDDLRNVAIVAHVDHGKTTLVDAMLQSSLAVETQIDKDDRWNQTWNQTSLTHRARAPHVFPFTHGAHGSLHASSPSISALERSFRVYIYIRAYKFVCSSAARISSFDHPRAYQLRPISLILPSTL